jgi:hypothetical protein
MVMNRLPFGPRSRASLNGLAATARRTIQGEFFPTVPNIRFEHEEPRKPVASLWKEVFPRLQGPLPPFGVSEWGASQGSYTLEYDARNPLQGDKAVHFLTHAFMAYELRWRGVAPYQAWQANDLQGRALEWITALRHESSDYEETYSLDDVIANRWGTAFGLGAFNNPELLIGHCRGLVCRIPNP